jgi:hypothetical protein
MYEGSFSLFGDLRSKRTARGLYIRSVRPSEWTYKRLNPFTHHRGPERAQITLGSSRPFREPRERLPDGARCGATPPYRSGMRVGPALVPRHFVLVSSEKAGNPGGLAASHPCTDPQRPAWATGARRGRSAARLTRAGQAQSSRRPREAIRPRPAARRRPSAAAGRPRSRPGRWARPRARCPAAAACWSAPLRR